MDKEIKDRIEYTVTCISEFSYRHSLPCQQAYLYLKNYGGIAFLKECYDAEHLLSINEAIDDLTFLCKRNGGNL